MIYILVTLSSFLLIICYYFLILICAVTLCRLAVGRSPLYSAQNHQQLQKWSISFVIQSMIQSTISDSVVIQSSIRRVLQPFELRRIFLRAVKVWCTQSNSHAVKNMAKGVVESWNPWNLSFPRILFVKKNAFSGKAGREFYQIQSGWFSPDRIW